MILINFQQHRLYNLFAHKATYLCGLRIPSKNTWIVLADKSKIYSATMHGKVGISAMYCALLFEIATIEIMALQRVTALVLRKVSHDGR